MTESTSRVSLDGPDDGFIEFEMTDESGEKKIDRVDLYEFSIALHEAMQRAEEEGGSISLSRMNAMRSVLAEYGVPAASMSNRRIDRICTVAMKRFDELKKKDDEAAGTLPNAE